LNKLSTQPYELNFEFSAGKLNVYTVVYKNFVSGKYGVLWHSSPTYKDCM
jgi:hypothetical protein